MAVGKKWKQKEFSKKRFKSKISPGVWNFKQFKNYIPN